MKKPILVLTSAFPPYAGSGVHRIVKFVKHLNHFGWDCHVLTIGASDRVDTTLMDDIPERTRVYRKEKQIEKVSNSFLKEGRKTFFKKVISILLSRVLIPDMQILSVISILRLGKKIISNSNIKIIFASSPPYSVLVGAVCLKKLTGAYLVVDFRDPWADRLIWKPFKHSVQKKTEKLVVKASDVVIANTKELERSLSKRYSGTRIITINNGYDRSDFENLIAMPDKSMPLKIVHAGEFYPEIRNPKSLLIAVGELYAERKIDSSLLRIDFFGGGELLYEDEFLDMIERDNLFDIVNVHDFIPHLLAIQEMMRADVLLLMQNDPGSFLQIPAKAFEYLYLRKAILSLSPDGATSNLIRETDSGVIVDPENIGLIKERILELISLKKLGRLHNSFTFRNIEQYDRRWLASKLSGLFDSILDKN